MIVVDNMPLSWGHHFESFTVATMTWLTVTQYLWHRRPWLVSLCRNHNAALCSYVTYHWSVDKSYNTLEQELITFPEHLRSPLCALCLRNLLFSVWCFVDRCLSFWFFFLLAIVLSVLRFTASDYPICYLQSFLTKCLRLPLYYAWKKIHWNVMNN
jgi:hypothetical protein